MDDQLNIYRLQQGKTYRVTKEFTDYDRIIHKTGEVWTFEKTTFLPYHSGLTLFVNENGKPAIYRFQSEPEEQQELLNHFMEYLEEI